MNIVFVLLAFSISAYIARLIIPCILLISFRKKLFDMPDERKVHKRAIPRLGGVSFFPTILLSCCAVLVIRTLTGYEISTLLASYILPEFLAASISSQDKNDTAHSSIPSGSSTFRQVTLSRPGITASCCSSVWGMWESHSSTMTA